ncbi:hypothetical protein L1887_09133 [Cichorium endivia]|nr:hypothetical protein L1887_09133 [Cichorium endivia]
MNIPRVKLNLACNISGFSAAVPFLRFLSDRQISYCRRHLRSAIYRRIHEDYGNRKIKSHLDKIFFLTDLALL